MSALFLIGAWDEVLAYLDEHIRTFKTDSAGTTCPFALGAFQVGALVFAHRGEIERAREVAGLMPKSEAPIGVVEGYQAMLANALGDPDTGRARSRSTSSRPAAGTSPRSRPWSSPRSSTPSSPSRTGRSSGTSCRGCANGPGSWRWPVRRPIGPRV